MKINKIYNETETKVCDGIKTEMNRCVIDNETIEEYLQNSIVKFVFLNSEYADISYDKNVTEIRKFKSKYPGNTYVRLPLKVVMDEFGKYGQRIDIIEDENEADGYVLVSKREFLKQNPKIKRNSRLRVDLCEQLCKEHLKDFNALLSGNVFRVKETNEQGEEHVCHCIMKKNKVENIDIEII